MIKILKKHKKKLIIGTSITVILGAGIFWANSTSGEKIIKLKINELYYSRFESEEYKNQFKETSYKNYTILHNEENEIILPLLFSYLDKMELKANEIFSYIPKDELTIQLDFNSKVYKERLSIGDPQRDGSGYYNSTLNTIYMNVEDVFREIIKGLPKIEKYDDGSFVMQSMGFKERLFNLYYNHTIESFLKDNNLNEEDFPIWFITGLKEYYSSMAEPIYKTSVFLSLEKLNKSDTWIKATDYEDKSNLFAQSTYLIYKIIKFKGKSGINEIIEKCKSKTFDESFNEVMGLPLNKFEEEVKKTYHTYDIEYYSISSSDFNEDIDVKIKCLEEYIKYNEEDTKAYEFLSSLYEINAEVKNTEVENNE